MLVRVLQRLGGTARHDVPLVAADAAAVSLALLAQPKLIPAGAVTDETTWGIMLAGTSVCVAQLALRPSAGSRSRRWSSPRTRRARRC
ncbi:hypothetical protein ACFQHO_40410 [Actinomadura yumaensis]|uniref:hypothetical protein n=1 Tax=Actinomadura yumaensis TaxID=111807 RepID=UPI003615B68C